MKLSTNMLALKEQMINQINRSFDQNAEKLIHCNPEECSAQLVSELTECIDHTINEAARSGLEQFVQSFETSTPPKTLQTHEREYRFNKISSNTFLTIFGPIKVKRAIYYSINPDNPDNPDELRNENSPRSYVPLDISTRTRTDSSITKNYSTTIMPANIYPLPLRRFSANRRQRQIDGIENGLPGSRMRKAELGRSCAVCNTIAGHRK